MHEKHSDGPGQIITDLHMTMPKRYCHTFGKARRLTQDMRNSCGTSRLPDTHVHSQPPLPSISLPELGLPGGEGAGGMQALLSFMALKCRVFWDHSTGTRDPAWNSAKLLSQGFSTSSSWDLAP